MREEKHIAEKLIQTQEGKVLKIKYEILTSTVGNELSYGIAIYLWDNDEKLNDFVKIPDITQKIVEIKTLFMVLYKYEVTPVTLYDVLDACLDDLESLADILN